MPFLPLGLHGRYAAASPRASRLHSRARLHCPGGIRLTIVGSVPLLADNSLDSLVENLQEWEAKTSPALWPSRLPFLASQPGRTIIYAVTAIAATAMLTLCRASDKGGCNGLLQRQAPLVRDWRTDRGGDCGRGGLAAQPNHGTSCSSNDKFASDYADSSVNHGAKAVTLATRLPIQLRRRPIPQQVTAWRCQRPKRDARAQGLRAGVCLNHRSSPTL